MKETGNILAQENDLGAATVEEARFYRNLPQQVGKAPENTHGLDFRLGEDSDGDPAVWITIFADDELAPSRKMIEDLTEYSERLKDTVLNSGFRRWPYIDIKAK